MALMILYNHICYLMKRLDKSLILLLMVALAVTFVSCSSRDKRIRKNITSILTPISSGNPYEIMVVAEDSIYDGYPGKSLLDVLKTPMKGLPRDEAYFKVSHVTPEHYDRITNLFRNIIRIVVDPNEYTMAKFRLERDVFSAPQAILTIQGPDVVSVSTYITEHTQFLLNFFTDEEINREATYLQDEHNVKFAQAVKEMFGCEFFIPIELNKMKKGDHFIWASNDAVSGLQNIVIYSYPYVSKDVFNRGVYLALRDSFMRENIPGEKPNMYMSTYRPSVMLKDINVRGHYAQEARGLWEMKNDMMGGPFVAHSIVDTIRGMIVVAEGFVYAPEKNKRGMIRKLEASLYTLNPLPEEKSEDKK